MPSNKLGTASKPEDTTEDAESSAMETSVKDEEMKMETEIGGSKVEEMNVDDEGKKSGKDEQSKECCNLKLRVFCKCLVTRLW
jgi:hypothetical protein